VSQPKPGGYRLDDREAERIFAQRIVPQRLSGGKASTEPIVVFVVGQPGAGKTRAQEALLKALDREGAVSIDADDLRAYHPRHDKLALADDLTVANKTHQDASHWVDMAIDHVIARRVDVAVSATFGNPNSAAEKIDRFRQAGYRVEVAVVAVDDVRSRLGVLQRYQDQRDSVGAGRYVPPQVQRDAYTGLLDTVDRVERDRLADAVHVYSRGGHQLYTNRSSPNGSERPPAARAAIETERARPWTAEEAQRVVQTATGLEPRLRAELRGELTGVVADARERIRATRDTAGHTSSDRGTDVARRAAQAWISPTQQARPEIQPSSTPAPARRQRHSTRSERGADRS
jgi:predicted ABC-type ATPase